MKTFVAKPETVKRDWYVVDAEGKTLGRIATEIASRLRGKHKPEYTPHVDTGDYIIVINAEKVRFTGKKMTEKEYVRYTGYPGGQRFETPAGLMRKFPERILEKAVKGMLPKNRLGSKLFTNLHVFVGAEHDKQAQQPKVINLDNIR